MQTPKKPFWILGAVVILIVIVAMVVSSNNKSSDKTKTTSNAANTNNSVSISKESQAVGKYLTDSKGKTLYTSDADKSGVSNCDAKCLETWPAYIATSSTGLPTDFSVIKRSDGTSQYAYKGMPLYYFTSDTTPGDITGNGLNGFHAVKP